MESPAPSPDPTGMTALLIEVFINSANMWTRGVVLKSSGGRLKQDLDKDF